MNKAAATTAPFAHRNLGQNGVEGFTSDCLWFDAINWRHLEHLIDPLFGLFFPVFHWGKRGYIEWYVQNDDTHVFGAGGGGCFLRLQ